MAAAVNDLKSTVSAQIDKIEVCEGNIKNINEQKDLICSVKDICNFDADTVKIIKGFDSADYTVEEKSRAFENVRNNISETHTDSQSDKSCRCNKCLCIYTQTS